MKTAAVIILIGVSCLGFRAGRSVYYTHLSGALRLEVRDDGMNGDVTLTPWIKSGKMWVRRSSSTLFYCPPKNTSWGFCFTPVNNLDRTSYVVPLGGGSIGLYDASTHKAYYPFNP